MSKKGNSEDRKKESAGALYNSLLARYPYFVNAIQSGTITAFSVMISQSLGADFRQVNWKEVGTMVFINIAWITPVLLWFFGYLNKLQRHPIDKLLIDQFIMSPPFTASIMALRFLLFDGGELAAVPGFLIKMLPGVQLIAWLFWIPSRFFIINYVPPSVALLVNSVASLVWNVIFSLLMKSINM